MTKQKPNNLKTVKKTARARPVSAFAATSKVQVRAYVNRNVIDHGIPCSGTSCPIARAIQAALEKDYPQIARNLTVDVRKAGIVKLVRRNGSDLVVKYKTRHSPRVKEFVKRFDKRWAVEPTEFKFTFDVTAEVEPVHIGYIGK